MNLCDALAEREASDQRVRVGWVGSGDLGRGMQRRAHRIAGLYPAIIADLNVSLAQQTFLEAGREAEDIVTVETVEEANAAMAAGKAVVTAHYGVACQCGIDVLVEATRQAETAARVAEMAIDHGKHTVMVTVEADCTVGTVLRQRADRAGVIYTLVDGDQSGNLVELVCWARALGFEVMAAGKGARFYPHHRAVRVGERPALRRRDREYDDGSRTFANLCSVANATGLHPDVGGPHMPSASLFQIPAYFRPRAEGGMLSRTGVIDAVDCLDADGITLIEPRLVNGTWIVVALPEADREYMNRFMTFTTENNAYGVLYRPYHLGGGEANLSVIKAALQHMATGAPLDQRSADVVAVAKAELYAGMVLEGMGSTGLRGELVDAAEARAERLLPAALAENVQLLVDVAEGTRLTYDMVEEPEDSRLWALRAEQDEAESEADG